MTKIGESLTSRQRWVLLLSSSASFVVVLDTLVVATALSEIQRGLHASLADLEWTVNAYTLTFAVLLMTGAVLGDRFGRRRMFAVGLTVFALASAACALAPGSGLLITARAVQGVGAAMIMPIALALLNDAFPPERRSWATGIYGAVTGCAVAVGPVLGGAVTQIAGWEWIFWINVPITAAIVLLLRNVPETRRVESAFDLRGLVLAAAAALGLTWGLVRAGAVGWTDVWVIATLFAGIVFGAAFVAWQRRARTPMLPMRLFRGRAFAGGNAAIFFVNATLTGLIFFAAQHPHLVLEDSPLSAGLRLIPLGVGPLLIAPRVGPWAARFGVRPLVMAGTALLAAGAAALAGVVAVEGGYGLMIAPMVVVSVGFAMAVPATTIAVISLSGTADLGKASGTFSTLRQLGGAFGVAITAAAFAATGDYSSPAAFLRGYAAAAAAAAGLALGAVLAGMALPAARTRRAQVRVGATAAEK